MKITILLMAILLGTAKKQLEWSDFQGTPQPGISASVCTEMLITDKEVDGKHYFTAEALFHPERSFVSPDCSRSEETLEHERLHLVITQVYTYEFLQKLEPFQGCEWYMHKAALYLCEKWQAELANEQECYDKFTEHGQNSYWQTFYLKTFKAKLKKYDKDRANKERLALENLRREQRNARYLRGSKNKTVGH